jgi:hypothetical protein
MVWGGLGEQAETCRGRIGGQSSLVRKRRVGGKLPHFTDHRRRIARRPPPDRAVEFANREGEARQDASRRLGRSRVLLGSPPG